MTQNTQNKQWHRTRVKNAILRIFPDMHAAAEVLAKRGRYKTCCGAYNALCRLTSRSSRYFNETLYAHLTDEFLPVARDVRDIHAEMSKAY